ncbi:aldo/keto reductase [Algoriphagus sp. H41]|uniref:Aldo/keto reductase n=1 Tax=Algoriphagus oliviformis TaxID=2811231 RepID=A0ABS3C424_9BACT|nr:aldo/keto reductase [Algoriphagus oliviformis]MBN7811868.1 aldo/keto reductase [Algoriphagus oliviformis]
MVLEENYRLSNGLEIPKLGLGTWFISDDKVAQAVKEAVALGYRHIDTAQAYQNERGVGEGVKIAGANREELFITTKLAAEIKNYQQALDAIDGSLETMGLDYIDLLIIHSPKPWSKFLGTESFAEGNKEAWRALEDAYKAGKLKAIGVSNFEKEDLENILAGCTVKPMVNQILAHIGNTPLELINFCQKQNILVEAYSPIGHGEIPSNEKLIDLAAKYKVGVAQLAIRYTLQLGLLPIPKTANPVHMKSNASVDFEISSEDMELLSNIERIENYGEASVFPVFAK